MMIDGKNETRIASLLGTWTSTIKIKAVIGSYQLLTYFVVHLMPDPMREYSCSMENCKELDNQVCVQQDKGNSAGSKCVNLTKEVVDWSDVSAFLYFGAKVDAGLPFNIHREHNTGGWVGPLSLILAQDSSAAGKQNDDKTVTLDRYVARYTKAPTTPYLHMDPNCTLFAEEDFERYMGSTAVNQTVAVQPNVTADQDPYQQYLKTCDNGDVKPILPLFEFTFVQDDAGKERVEVKLNYKVLTIPHKKDIMYKVFPWMQPRVNRRHRGFHISGPYCYGDDPKRGYTFDLNYDSTQESPFMSLIHACAQGLPCLPSAAKLFTEGSDIIHNATKIDTATVDVGSMVFMSFAVYLLLLLLLISVTCNCRMSRRLRREQFNQGTTSTFRRPEPEVPEQPGPFGDLEEDGGLSEPLLDTDQEGNEEGGTADEEGKSETARVEFV